MTTQIDSATGAHVRWLLVGAFSPKATGSLSKVSRNNFTECLAAAKIEVSLTVSDRLGTDNTRAFVVTCDSLSAFKLAGVVERIPLLQSLRTLAEDVGSADPARRPSAEQTIERVVTLVGEGKLATSIRQAVTPRPQPSVAASSPTPTTTTAAEAGSALDRIFSQVHDAQPACSTPVAAVNNFVDAVRKSDGVSPTEKYSLGSAPARQARTVIEDAVYGTAADLLRTTELQSLEAAWRGVKLVVDETPREQGLEIELLDTPVKTIPASIEATLSTDRAEWPDAIFIVDPMADADQIGSLAELASSLNTPVLITTPDEIFTKTVKATGGRNTDEVVKAMDPAWLAFRSNELARWVCAGCNRVVVNTEGQATTKRTVLASPAFAAAAMLTASYRDTGLFGRVFGPTGGLKCPAVHSVSDGHAEAMLPVERFAPITVQADLAAVGLMALGSAKNTDKVVATSWPTLSSSSDAIGFPAQIITGRVVRFALWVRDQIPVGTLEPDIKVIFEQAATVFLFPGINEGAFLDARVVADQSGAPRMVHLDVTVRAALAGAPVQLGFDVPLNLQ